MEECEKNRLARAILIICPVARNAATAILWLAIVAISAPLGVATVSAQTAAGSITELTGTAHLQRAGATSIATLNMLVQAGDRLNTDASSSLTIVLTDASRLQLDESSSLVIDEHVLGPGGGRAVTKVSLFNGFVRSFVNLTAGGSTNFEVHTPNAVAAARGTDYLTGYMPGSTRIGFAGCNRFTDVAVYEGTVGLSQAATPNGVEVPITAGYETSVPCGLAPLAPGPLGLTGAFGGSGSAGNHVLAPAPIGAPPPSCPPCPGT